MRRRYAITEMLEMVYQPNRAACFRILAGNWDLFTTVPGSSCNHQAWPGGYYDHVEEVMNMAIVLYDSMSARRPLPFSLSDALLVLFLHDIEKPWKYELGEDGELRIIESLRAKEAQHAFRDRKLQEEGIVLTPDQKNGMRYVEGELNDYSGSRRVMGELAAFCHMADIASARIWHDYPLAENDPWEGAKRMRQ